MDVLNRMADVIKLRNNACQDFLKLVISDGWQQEVYRKAEREVKEGGRFKVRYTGIYDKMREIGADNYTIEKMDVSIISEITEGLKWLAPTEEKTRKALEALVVIRNDTTGHSGSNEDAEELYLQGLLDLCNLRRFVKTVDKYEKKIDDKKRQEYLQEYTKRIRELMDCLDEERISIIKKRKEIQQYIQNILACSDEKQKMELWSKTHKMYMDKCLQLDHDVEGYYEFIVSASDAGITSAHNLAASYYFNILNDYEEGERRLFMLYNSYDSLPFRVSSTIIETINMFLNQEQKLSEGLERLVSNIAGQGYNITSEKGFYRISPN